MLPETCPEEGRIVEAMRRGTISGDLQRHATQCANCRDALAIAQFLADPGEPTTDVPAWGLVYWKAELRARRDQAERALRPMQQMQIAAIIALLVIVIVAGVISHNMWLPAGAIGFGIVLAGVMIAVRKMLLRDS